MYTAFIIEPRRHKALAFVLTNFVRNLPSPKWKFLIFHGNGNKEYVENIIDTHLRDSKERIDLVPLGVDNLTIREYNDLLKSADFYKKIPTEVFLSFQTDTLIFDQYAGLIEDFIEYDYVGAPWCYHPIFGSFVGNGGLSLRRKSKMLEIIENKEYDPNENKDTFFCNHPTISIYKPSVEKAKLFSVEDVFSPVSFGCHKPWPRDRNYGNALRDLHPELDELLMLQGIE